MKPTELTYPRQRRQSKAYLVDELRKFAYTGSFDLKAIYSELIAMSPHQKVHPIRYTFTFQEITSCPETQPSKKSSS